MLYNRPGLIAEDQTPGLDGISRSTLWLWLQNKSKRSKNDTLLLRNCSLEAGAYLRDLSHLRLTWFAFTTDHVRTFWLDVSGKAATDVNRKTVLYSVLVDNGGKLLPTLIFFWAVLLILRTAAGACVLCMLLSHPRMYTW